MMRWAIRRRGTDIKQSCADFDQLFYAEPTYVERDDDFVDSNEPLLIRYFEHEIVAHTIANQLNAEAKRRAEEGSSGLREAIDQRAFIKSLAQRGA